jgi:hypothetical protein
VTNDYTSSTDAFADMSEGNYSSSDYPQMSTFVTAASRLIDREIGRWDGFFYPTTDSAIWFFDGSGECEQEIDEFVSISEVAVSEGGGLSSTDYIAWTLNTDYLTRPYNHTPINRLALVEYNGTKGAWYTGQKTIRVTGIPGYSSTPPDIVIQACKMQAVRWFMRAKQGYQDTGGSVAVGSMTFTGKLELDPDVRQLLWPLILELS